MFECYRCGPFAPNHPMQFRICEPKKSTSIFIWNLRWKRPILHVFCLWAFNNNRSWLSSKTTNSDIWQFVLYVFVSHCVFYVLFLSFVHFINAWWLSDPYWHILATSYYSLTESESNDNKSDGTSNNIDNNNSELWIQDLCSYFGALLLSFSFVFVSNFLMIFRANQMPSACTHTHIYMTSEGNEKRRGMRSI